MSRRFLRAMKTSIKMRNSKAHPPIAPTMSGKNEDCPFVSTFVLGLMTGLGVDDVTKGSKKKTFKLTFN